MRHKLVFLLDNLCFGGAEIQTAEIMNRLSPKDFDITVISLGAAEAIADRIRDDIPVKILKKKTYADMAIFSALCDHFEEIGPDTAIFVNTYAMMYGYLALKKKHLETRAVLAVHTTKPRSLKENVQNRLYSSIVNKMDMVVFVCRNQEDFWKRFYGIRETTPTRVIFNGVDTSRFTGFEGRNAGLSRSGLGIPADRFIIAVNACFRPEKRHEDIIDAFELVLKSGMDAYLLLIGDGARRQAIENRIAERRLNSRIMMTGFVNDVRPYLSCSDISILASVSESLPLSAIESMAMGIPVIIPDVGGARELVTCGAEGILYDPGDIIGLYEAIRSLYNSDCRDVMGIYGIEKAKACFDIGMTVDSYRSMLIQLGSSRKALKEGLRRNAAAELDIMATGLLPSARGLCKIEELVEYENIVNQ